MLPSAPEKINETAKVNNLDCCFLMILMSQKPMPISAKIRNIVKANLATSSEIKELKSLSFAPQAIPSFSTNNILNQLKITTSCPSSKWVFI